jgi:hypothetical protein
LVDVIVAFAFLGVALPLGWGYMAFERRWRRGRRLTCLSELVTASNAHAQTHLLRDDELIERIEACWNGYRHGRDVSLEQLCISSHLRAVSEHAQQRILMRCLLENIIPPGSAWQLDTFSEVAAFATWITSGIDPFAIARNQRLHDVSADRLTDWLAYLHDNSETAVKM